LLPGQAWGLFHGTSGGSDSHRLSLRMRLRLRRNKTFCREAQRGRRRTPLSRCERPLSDRATTAAGRASGWLPDSGRTEASRYDAVSSRALAHVAGLPAPSAAIPGVDQASMGSPRGRSRPCRRGTGLRDPRDRERGRRPPAAASRR